MKKILLNSAKNNTNVNVESGEYVSLSTKQRSIPLEKAEATINHYELYLKERNECKKYKMYFTIHPYMTNVLPNVFTEVVYNEGSIMSDIITPEGTLYSGHNSLFEKNIHNKKTKDALFNYDVFIEESNDKAIDRRYQMIRDTEYSHPQLGCLTYHCGLDIFNNHYLRSDGFFRIRKANNDGNRDVFNTIEDFLIYSDGNIAKHVRETPGETTIEVSNNENGIIKQIIDWVNSILEDDTVTETEERETHLFSHENILPVYDAFMNGVKEDNGWIGFYNKSYLPEINFSTNVTVNKCLNDKEACAFVDLYPDRTLFSFLPKINNEFGSREEYNWGWCLTYPYDSTTKDENGNSFDFFNEQGLKLIWGTTSSLYHKVNNEFNNVLYDEEYNNVIREGKSVYFRTKCKHNLNPNDIIRFKNDEYDFSLRVMNIGNEQRKYEKYYFSVSYDDLSDEFGEKKIRLVMDDEKPNEFVDVFYIQVPKNLYVTKIVNGMPCKYYIRKFKKLGNFHSTMNRMAFSNTIFNDRVSQILYDDDINVSDLKDNLGREVSEIFLTFVKNNKGWEKYYLSGVTSPVSVEYSHCFGRVTSGFNFECEEDEITVIRPTNNITSDEYFQKHNVRSLYNLENFEGINLTEFCNVMGINFTPPNCIENNIKIDDSVFYGDFVEFSPLTVTEVVIEDVFHRFNTAQRETNLKNEYFKFDKFKYDEIEFDDFDFNISANEDGKMPSAVDKDGIPYFSVKINHDGFRKNLMAMENISEENKNIVRDNIFPEGYFYKPHYKIKLKEYSNIISNDFDILLVKGSQIDVKQDNQFKRFSFPVDSNYGFLEGDKIVLYYSSGVKKEYFVYPSFEKNRIAFYDYEKTLVEITNGLEKIFYKNRNIPTYAYYTGDGSGKYIWRELIKDTELTQDSDIYDRMYANGSVYINTNINFYLRRQDPYGIYGLRYTTSESEDAANFIINGIEVDKGDVDYKTEENYSVCEI